MSRRRSLFRLLSFVFRCDRYISFGPVIHMYWPHVGVWRECEVLHWIGWRIYRVWGSGWWHTNASQTLDSLTRIG
ncbi:hypothetical protein FGIG_11945 [Fasciola gigantica]|uniref:Uncharacterized protein n=1 Tax=Fasciola gigantica TaxID=46835 RepID=A0A504YTV3_FASGI|nr:hypothetical protein FGIG_11945 [Fasciola gigantica]